MEETIMKSANKSTKAKKLARAFCAVLMVGMMLALTVSAAGDALANVTAPIVNLLNRITKVLIPVVVAIGGVYCVFLGIKFAKAEEPQDQMKAKQALKNAIIGFVLIFVLLVILRVGMKELGTWMTEQIKNY